MTGVSETQFAPDRTMSRAMAVTVLYRMDGEPVDSGSNTFTDVTKSSYCYDAVSWATQNGIVNGVSATRFAPDADIRLRDFITMLHRYKILKNPNSELVSFARSDYYQAALDWAVHHSIVQGSDNYRIQAEKPATRGEVAAILKRYAEMETNDDPGVLYDIDPLAVESIYLRRNGEFRTVENEEDIRDFCEKLNGYRYSSKSYLPTMEGWDNYMKIYLKDGTESYLGEISADCVVIGNIVFHNAEPSNGNQNSYFTDDWFTEWFPQFSWES